MKKVTILYSFLLLMSLSCSKNNDSAAAKLEGNWSIGFAGNLSGAIDLKVKEINSTEIEITFTNPIQVSGYSCGKSNLDQKVYKMNVAEADLNQLNLSRLSEPIKISETCNGKTKITDAELIMSGVYVNSILQIIVKLKYQPGTANEITVISALFQLSKV